MAVWAFFSDCNKRGYSVVVMHGFPNVVASSVAEHEL